MFHLKRSLSNNTHQEINHESVSQYDWFTREIKWTWSNLTILHESWSICSVIIEFIFVLFFIQFFYFFKFFKTKKRKKFFDFFVFSKIFQRKISSYYWLFSFRQKHLVGNLIFNVIYHIFLFLEKKGFILFFQNFPFLPSIAKMVILAGKSFLKIKRLEK